MTSSSRSGSTGFSMKSNAPRLRAWTAVVIVLSPETITTPVSGAASRIITSASSPLMPGMLTSSSTTSKPRASSAASAAVPSGASLTA